MSDQLNDFLKERNRAFEALDLEWARKMLPPGTSDEMLLLSMHKARAECMGISAEARQASRAWLAANGYKRIGEVTTGSSLPRAAPPQSDG